MTRRRPPARILVRIALLAALLFAVHAVQAGREEVVIGDAPLMLGPSARVTGEPRVRFRLPAGYTASPGRPGVWDRVTYAGPVRCRAEATVSALASQRGVRFDPATSTLDYRLDGRRTLRVATRASAGARESWRGRPEDVAVGSQPVAGLVRFPTRELVGAPVTLVRVSLAAFADTSSPVQRTPEALAACTRRARAVAPAVFDAVLGTAEVTSARRGAP